MKKIALLCGLCLFGLAVQAQQPLTEAEQAYNEGRYSDAITLYEGVLSSGYESAVLYYNLGNAYYRTGAMAPAILNYERSLRLAPGNDDTWHNLELARARTVDKIDCIEPMVWEMVWKACRNVATADTWAYCGIGLFWLCLLCLFVYSMSKRLWLRKTGFSVAVVALFACIIITIFALQQKTWMENKEEAIVFAPTTTVKSTPDQSGTDLFVLHEGTKVYISTVLGNWIEVHTEDGNKGWIPAKAIEVI